ncbi:hypothetical protein TcasGA2_TC032591 [Tribolium castaneum]|uniref:Uncharacterized protein n=1 Tax=Tribolium castaneum TaxID=7070 RepID=A0A139WKA1_TRICA|nr:hypothetical protein TcasGA2_TC032591 [Tribolium castaneum]
MRKLTRVAVKFKYLKQSLETRHTKRLFETQRVSTTKWSSSVNFHVKKIQQEVLL